MKTVSVLRHGRRGLFFILWILFFFFLTGTIIFNTEPATGGDTGSHYWPLVTLIKEALPQFSVRIWNPGNLGGEPHLTHYFPLPYFFMAFLSIFLPLGMSFNIGTLIPLFLYPFCVFQGLRKAGLRESSSILGGSLSFVFLYSESFSMWGGNSLSTLAGQFAHLYALCLFHLALGYSFKSVRENKISLPLILSLSGILLSHFYVAIFVPFVFLGVIIFAFCFESRIQVVRAFWRLFQNGIFALGLSAWFVFPMIDNSKWNTAFGFKWISENILKESFPAVSWPVLILLLSGFLFSIFGWKWIKDKTDRFLFVEENKILFSLLTVSVSAILSYFWFPKWGLVDIRIFPILYVTIIWLTVILWDRWVHNLVPLREAFILTSIISLGFLVWSHSGIKNFPSWIEWNYSSWSSKKAYPELKKLTSQLAGDFSDPRIIYENSELSNSAGTMRVFEMLPYFSGRSTWESVYMQATIMAPQAFYVQALISRTPSCPFPNFECTSYNLSRLEKYLNLMGVSDLILIDKNIREQADTMNFLDYKGKYGIWHWYHYKEKISYVDLAHEPIEEVSPFEYKEKFYNEFVREDQDHFSWKVVNFSKKFSSQFANLENLSKTFVTQLPYLKSNGDSETCNPMVQVSFNQIRLETQCPGVFHRLKFAYHPAFKSDNGEDLYLVNPGYLGIVPTRKVTTLVWGQSIYWKFWNFISYSFGLVLLVYLATPFFQRKKKIN